MGLKEWIVPRERLFFDLLEQEADVVAEGARALLEFLRGLLVDRFLRLLQEGLEVPHPEEAGDEPGRVELLEVLNLLPDPHEHDGGLRLRDRAEGPASLRGPVELRQDHARDSDRLVERLRLGARLLARRGVEDEDRLVRLHDLRDRLDLLDQVPLEGVTSARVHDHDLRALEHLQSRLRDLHRVLLPAVPVERDLDRVRELLQLIVRGGPVRVRRDDTDTQTLLLEVPGELADRRRLPLAVQADHQDPLFRDRELPRLPEDLHELLVDDPDDVLTGAHPRGRLLLERPLLKPTGDPPRELDVHVRLEEGPLDVADDLLDQGLVDVGRARDLPEDVPEGRP